MTTTYRPNPTADMTADDVRRFAKMYGLEVGTHAPGDGVRRYQFISGGGSNKRILFTGLGIREAEVWLRGFMSGADSRAENPPKRHQRNPRKGKFDSDLDAAMYRLSLDGNASDEASFHDNWYGRLDAVTFDEVVQAFVDDGEDEHSARKAWQQELKGKIRGDMIPVVIIHEDHNGITTVRYFASDREGGKFWDEIQRDALEAGNEE
jgi:hypothetical protein